MDDIFDDGAQAPQDWMESVRKVLYRTRFVLRRYWWVFVPCMLLGAGALGLLQHFSEPVYVSRAEMIVSGRMAVAEGSSVYREDLENFYGTQVRLIEGPQVAENARLRVREERPELMPPEDLRYNALLARDADVFVVEAYGGDPEYVQVYLDAVLEEFIAFRQKMRAQTSDRTREALSNQLALLEGQIERAERDIVQFKEANNIVFIREQQATAADFLNRYQRQLAELETELRLVRSISDDRELEQVFLDVHAASAGAGGEVPPEQSVANNLLNSIGTDDGKSDYLESRSQLAELRTQLEEFSLYMRPKHPKIIELKTQIERLDNLMLIQRREAFKALADRKLTLQNSIANLEEEIEIWEKEALENSRLAAEYEILEDRLGRVQEAYLRNQEAIAAVDESQQVQQETITPLLSATQPRAVISNLAVESAKGAVAGMFAASAILFLIGFADNRVLAESDLDRHFNHTVLGTIPFEKETGNRDCVLLQREDDRYVFAEACRNLRTSVFFLGAEGATPGTILVTSAVPAEGKSTVSANLAVALSFSRSRVLLIDADLRKGRLHRIFKLRQDDGVADVLEGRATIDDCVQRTSYDNLDFLSTGQYPKAPAELFLGDRFDEFLDRVRERYDFVIFDTAPILATEDTASFASKMDAVLFVIRCAYTQIRQVKPAIARLEGRKVDISGLVLNYVDMSQPGYYHYKYSEYYSDGKTRKRSRRAAGS